MTPWMSPARQAGRTGGGWGLGLARGATGERRAVDDRLDRPVDSQLVEQGLTQDLVVAASHERVACSGVDQPDRDHPACYVHDLGVLA